MNDFKKKTARCMRIAFAVFGLMLFSGALMAQNVRVTGKVIDTNGEPLVGVYVLVDGTRTGTSTDVDGAYILNAPANATLVFSS